MCSPPLVHTFDVGFYGHRHALEFCGRGLDVALQTGIFCGLGGTGAKNGNARIPLFEAWKILEKGLNARRTEEDQYVVIHISQIRQIAGYRLV